MKTAELVTWTAPSMGGSLRVVIRTDTDRRAAAADAARRAGRRVESWARRLTRFSETSDLARLNSAGSEIIEIRPTLAAALEWAEQACRRGAGIVNPALLDARLAAEAGNTPTSSTPPAGWRLTPTPRGALIERDQGVRFDLDGLAKGWIADRAAALLADWPGVAVDADGDVSLRADAGVEWLVAVADPRSASAPTDSHAAPLATLRLTGGNGWTASYGVATSGTSVHRWRHADGREGHHLIDPRTRRPAETDVVQATVVAPSAREAEVLAKAAVILGADDAFDFLERSAALAAILLLVSGDVVAAPGIESWLA